MNPHMACNQHICLTIAVQYQNRNVHLALQIEAMEMKFMMITQVSGVCTVTLSIGAIACMGCESSDDVQILNTGDCHCAC